MVHNKFSNGDNNDSHDRSFLNAKQLQDYTSLITDKGEMSLIRLLTNGISVRDILNLRTKDIRGNSFRVKLMKPRRMVGIDKVTMWFIGDYLTEENIPKKSIEKAFLKFPKSTIAYFIKDYGIRSKEIDFYVTPTTLLNTFFIIRIIENPEWTVEDYNRHLGRTDMNNTNKIINYYKEKIEELKEKDPKLVFSEE